MLIFEEKDPDASAVELITRQLGRPPKSVAGIACVCSRNAPLVVITKPLIKRSGRIEPFPTVFWLSCPLLVKEVGKLESSGLIQELEKAFQDDPILKETFYDAHREYVELRLKLLSPDEREFIEKEHPGIWKVLVETGIGGVKDWNRIKCLHAHLAHYLATGNNPVGYAVSDILGLDTMVCTLNLCGLGNKPAVVLDLGGMELDKSQVL